MTLNPHEALDVALTSHRVVYVQGPNFSARSDALQHAARLPIHGAHPNCDSYGHRLTDLRSPLPGERFAYVGSEIYQAMSGLASTVRAEVALNSIAGCGAVDQLCDRVGLAPLLGKNPFELSGGEQALLAVVAGTALRPRVLALDCCLEQVDKGRREVLMDALGEFSSESSVIVADNELADLPRLEGSTTVFNTRSMGAGAFSSMSLAASDYRLTPLRPAPTISMNGVRFSYRHSEPLLDSVDLDLHPGRAYWLRGANGAGKSTLAKLLAGVLEPQQGAIYVDGIRTRLSQSPGSLVSYHFQNPDFQLFSTTVWDEVLAGPTAAGCTAIEASTRARKALMQLAIPETLHNRHPLDLPFALRKRLAIAATLASGAPWVLLDEPSLSQDATNTAAVASLVRGLVDGGIGVILISHSNLLASSIDAATLTLENGSATLQPFG